jgi:murein DD-endopeptidase MepM/ murein hydrolase activator NlpD
MAKDASNPKNSPTNDQAEEQSQIPVTGSNPVSGALSRLKSFIPSAWRRYVGIAIIVVFALLIVGIMRNYASGIEQTRQEQLYATAQALAQPQIDAVTGGEAGALMPSFGNSSSPFSQGITRKASLDTIIPSRPRVGIELYTVAQGDSVFSIADKFELKPESILWFNVDTLADNPREIFPDQVLRIPPVDGVLHEYNTGESLVAIAAQYDTYTEPTAQDIIEWPGNNLDPYETNIDNPNIPDGTLLIVPNGSRELQNGGWGPPSVTRDNPAAAAYYGPGSCGSIYAGAIGTYSFIWPTVANYLSGNDWTPPIHNGIDIAGAEGNSVFASDSGVVVYAGWSNYGFGNLLVIDHGTGFQTAYAHLNSIAVSCGVNVSQGEVVGSVGNTGNSTGPHLHFEITNTSYGKVNPWDYVSAP